MEQGDTCELCYLAHVIPVDEGHRLDDGFANIAAAVAAEVSESLGDLLGCAVAPSRR